MTGVDTIIFTNSRDAHASCVELVLTKMSRRVLNFNTAQISKLDRLSVSYLSDRMKIDINDFLDITKNVSSSWNRRFSKLFSLPDKLHPADENYVRNNLHTILNGIVLDIDRKFPVNPLYSSRLLSNKMLQLQTARACGLETPKTLISNSVDDISDFIDVTGDVCFKPFITHGWTTDTGPVQALTTKIVKSDLENVEAVKVFPHIFQEFVRKSCEYRVTLFGGYHDCVKIDVNKLPSQSSIDWRASPHYINHISKADLPVSVIDKLRKFMKIMGLRFGTFDLAETPNGDMVFFEVNEAGQWLWKELYCDDCVLLQPFCEYLSQADDNFTWNRSSYSKDLSAAIILKEISLTPDFNGQIDDDFPDEFVHASNEISP